MTDNPEHGMLPEGWGWRALGEVAEFINGGTPSTKIPEYWNGDIPWITGADVTSFWVHGGRKFIKKEGIDNSATHLVKEKTVLLVTRTGVGKVGIATTDLCFSQDITGVICGKKILPEYLARFILSQENNLKRLQRGSTIKGLIRTDVEHLKIPLPPLPTQHKIVEILEKADAVRKKRRLADEKTSKILQAAFVKMFGDPDIPKETIGNVVKKTEIRDPTKNPDEEFIYVDISGIDNQTGTIKETKRFLGRDAPSRAKRVMRAGDVIVSTVRPNLNATALVPDELDYQICSTGFCVLQCGGRLNNRYLYVFTRLKPFVEQLVSKMKGASYPAVNNSDVLKVEIPLPPLELQQKFAKLVEKVEAMREKQTKSGEHIEETFQALMQKAFRGELVA